MAAVTAASRRRRLPQAVACGDAVAELLSGFYPDEDWIDQAVDGCITVIERCAQQFGGRAAPMNYMGGDKVYAEQARTTEEHRKSLQIGDDGVPTRTIHPNGFLVSDKKPEALRLNQAERRALEKQVLAEQKEAAGGHDPSSVPWL